MHFLGIDSPEVRHDEHGIPLDQSFGPEARAFAQGAFAAATDVKLIRAGTLDPYGRTLGYLIINGKNYSVLIVRARLAEESVSHYGDNGLPVLAAEVTAAARAAGPMPFEPPYVFRKRMRVLSETAKGATRGTSSLNRLSRKETPFLGSASMSVSIVGWKGETGPAGAARPDAAPRKRPALDE